MSPLQGIRLLALGLAVLAVQACAPFLLTPDQLAARAALDSRRTALEPLSEWQAVGRLSVQSGEQAWHASLVWRQEGEDYRIRLLGPLGQQDLVFASRHYLAACLARNLATTLPTGLTLPASISALPSASIFSSANVSCVSS